MSISKSPVLTPSERFITRHLAAAGGWVSADELAREALHFMGAIGPSERDLVRQYIYRIRRVLGPGAIASQRGRGYRWTYDELRRQGRVG